MIIAMMSQNVIIACIVLQIVYLDASCPFASSLLNGQRNQLLFEQKKAQLLANDFLIEEGDPAWVIWQMIPYDPATIDLYTRSDALLQAQQFYVEQCQQQRSKMVGNQTISPLPSTSQLLRQATRSVSRSDRCKPQPKCDPAYKYVRTDGACNNLAKPTLGGSFSPYSRLVPADYDDGINALRRSRWSREPLPSPRRIGNIALQQPLFDGLRRSSSSSSSVGVPNHGSLIFGQYITHDSGFKDVYQNYEGGDGLRCCSKDNKRALGETEAYAHCMAMEVPANDPFYSQFGGGCLDYIRSQAVFGNDCVLGAAEISSSVTHHLDQSNIYASDDTKLATVRSFIGGRLLMNSANDLFPRTANCTGDFCYYTGDIRGAFYPTLSLWHSIFMRYHNRIADGLHTVNGHWSDETLFQETRRILTAVYQHIVFDEWLPGYVNVTVLRRRNVLCPVDEADDVTTRCGGRYEPTVDGATMNEFSVGVFRMFHANTPDSINMYDARYRLARTLPLNESIHGAGILETQYLGMMRGFFKDPIWLGKYPDNIRNTVFSNKNAHGIGLDLLSVDIARGRDHGLAPYHVYLERYWLGRRKVRDWSDLAQHGIMSSNSLQKLRLLYDSVFDVDMLVGLLLEEKGEQLTGPVGGYLMEEQFYRYKYGNRFFYTHANGAHPFSDEQLHSIRRMGFADVLCQCSDIGRVPERVFETLGVENRLRKCSDRRVDLSLWREPRPNDGATAGDD